MNKINIFDRPETNLPIFCRLVCNQAIEDHKAGRKTRRAGRDLCLMFCDNWRAGHVRLASAIYGKTRWSLELHDRALAAQSAGSPSGTNGKETP